MAFCQRVYKANPTTFEFYSPLASVHLFPEFKLVPLSGSFI